jgi:glucose/arabinose dehydrogenase
MNFKRTVFVLSFLLFFVAVQPLVGPASASGEVDTVIEGLDTVWELAWGPDGKLYMTERRGNLLAWDGSSVKKIAELPVVERGESGLMGMALDPQFEENELAYTCFTTRTGDGLENVVERFRLGDDEISERKRILDGMNASFIHDGCRLGFGPEDKLLVTMGDSSRGSLAQDPGSLNGKVLRIGTDGGVPEDNPFGDSPVYSLGHRNPQGLDVRPGTDEIYVSEHGPAANDEINRILPGRNYGWPEVGGTTATEEYEPALWDWTPTIAPAGISFFGPEKLYLATLKESRLHKLTLNESGEIIDDEVVLEGYGRLRAVTTGPDGECLYVSTSNRDGRGRPREGDDRVLRYCPE